MLLRVLLAREMPLRMASSKLTVDEEEISLILATDMLASLTVGYGLMVSNRPICQEGEPGARFEAISLSSTPREAVG
jgi:hypothetical protein